MSTFDSIPLPLQLYMPLILLICVLVPTVVLLALTARDRGWVEAGRRAWLGFRLRHLRMQRMLSLRGIDPARYLALTPLAILRQELTACSTCSRKEFCDNAWFDGANAVPPTEYCPNVASLDRRWLRKLH